MGREAEVTKAVMAVRSDELGLHWTTLAKRSKLLDELGTDDPHEGVALLTALLQRLDDDATPRQQQDATVLRWVMAVDCPPIKNVTARREAVGAHLFMKSHNTVLDAEKRAISRLVALILEAADKRNVSRAQADPFTAASPDDLLQSPVITLPPEPDWYALAFEMNGKRLSRRMQCGMAAQTLVMLICYVLTVTYVPHTASDYFWFSALTIITEAFFIAVIIDLGRLPERPSLITAELFTMFGGVPSWKSPELTKSSVNV